MTLLLVEPLSDDQLNRVYSDILSPLAWDLGHIANFEELWLVQRIGGREPMDGALGRFYDAIENPRTTRNELPILRGEELRGYMAEVRERTLEVLDTIELGDTGDPLLRDGFVYELILAHEHQHNETMLQLLQMVERYEPVAPRAPAEDPQRLARGQAPHETLIEGGRYEIGAGEKGFAYDNERPRHSVELAPFEIDRTPVTNESWIEFMDDTRAEPPLYWERDGEGGWVRTAMAETREVDPLHPVVHVDHVAATAYAEWVGKRLPTEFEWEAAAPSLQTLGRVWEWTSSDFEAYPGFKAFPYDEYSKVFFGSEHKVLRGGSWATHESVIRTSFRNWDLPERRQIFSGLRCARDA